MSSLRQEKLTAAPIASRVTSAFKRLQEFANTTAPGMIQEHRYTTGSLEPNFSIRTNRHSHLRQWSGSYIATQNGNKNNVFLYSSNTNESMPIASEMQIHSLVRIQLLRLTTKIDHGNRSLQPTAAQHINHRSPSSKVTISIVYCHYFAMSSPYASGIFRAAYQNSESWNPSWWTINILYITMLLQSQ